MNVIQSEMENARQFLNCSWSWHSTMNKKRNELAKKLGVPIRDAGLALRKAFIQDWKKNPRVQAAIDMYQDLLVKQITTRHAVFAAARQHRISPTEMKIVVKYIAP